MSSVRSKPKQYTHDDPAHPYKETEEYKAWHREVYKNNPEYFLNFYHRWQKRNPNYVKEYYSTHHKVSVTNKNRTKQMWTAQNEAAKIPLAPLCELCPPDDIRPAVIRHHPDYNYPLIFISTCKSCHTCVHKDLIKQGISIQHLVEVTA